MVSTKKILTIDSDNQVLTSVLGPIGANKIYQFTSIVNVYFQK